MKIAITGASGMLGQALCQAFAEGLEVIPWGHPQLDITSLEQVGSKIVRLRPDWVINAAAYTDVDQAESEAALACRVNALGSRHLALACREAESRLLSYSTDYVFDGEANRPYSEDDPVGPINRYGRSKWMGEDYIRSLCPRHLIIRTSWLYGPGGKHFAGTMLRLAASRSEIEVVDGQIGSPTYSCDLAAKTRQLVERDCRGTYHVTNSGHCSKYEFTRRIVELSGFQVKVSRVPSSRFPRPAARPRYSVLENRRLVKDAIPLLRPWQDALANYLESRA